MILVTGCPRSGTGYTAKALKAAGLDVGHEVIGKDGVVSWLHTGEGQLPWLADPVKKQDYGVVLHQVRHPLNVISSFQTISDEAFEFMFSNLGEKPKGERGLYWYMWAWLKWNERIEALADYRYCIEDIETAWPEICKRVGIDKELPVISKSTNSRPHNTYTWAHLKATDKKLYKKITKKAIEYGYEIKPDEKRDLPKITLCMMGITDNDFPFLEDCLKSVRGLWDHFVFIDTQSSKHPLDIVRKEGGKIYRHPWANNYSIHRNQSLSYVPDDTDWVFFIDPDERFIADIEKFKADLLNIGDEFKAISFPLHDMHGGKSTLSFNSPRMFRKGHIHYRYAKHNTPYVGGLVANYADARYEHYGYDLGPDAMAGKDKKTLEMLYARLKEDPKDYATYFYLAQSEGGFGRHEQSLKYAETYISKRGLFEGFNNSVYFTAAQTATGLKQYDKAKALIDSGLKIIPNDIDLNWAAMFYGIAVTDIKYIYDGAVRYIEAYNAYQEDPASQKERFVFKADLESYAMALYHLGAISLDQGARAFKQLRKLSVKSKDNEPIQESFTAAKKYLKDGGVSINGI